MRPEEFHLCPKCLQRGLDQRMRVVTIYEQGQPETQFECPACHYHKPVYDSSDEA